MNEILILTCEVCNKAFYDRDPEETWCADCRAADLEQDYEDREKQ